MEKKKVRKNICVKSNSMFSRTPASFFNVLSNPHLISLTLEEERNIFIIMAMIDDLGIGERIKLFF